MGSPAPIGLRGVRAAIFGCTTLVLAAAAHVSGGGSLPSLPMLLAVGVPLGCASVVLARRARGLGGILAFLALGQVVLHETFMSAGRAATCVPVDAPAAHPAAMHGMSVASCTPMASMAGPQLPSWLMLAMHAVAVLATALVLAYGERVALRLWTWLRPRVVLADVRVAVRTRALTAFRVAQLVPAPRFSDDVARRGPPRGLVPVLSPA